MLGAGAALAALTVAAIAVFASSSAESGSSATPILLAPKLPASPEPALDVPEPAPLEAAGTSTWANVRRAVFARARPSPTAKTVVRLETRTPEGTSNIVLVLGREPDDSGRIWVHVRLPVLPNDLTGWVPRDALGSYGVVHTRLFIDLRRFTATLLRDGRVIFSAPIGVGLPAWPTPTGQFYVRNRLSDYDSAFYGPLAFGTSARSAVLTDWPDGGFVGIHGTNQPELLPGRISHGCIRVRNADILELGRLMPIGTPITIR